MTQISRLKNAEISNGNLIDADDLSTEFDQLINESNAQDARLDDIEASNMSINGVKTFGSIPVLPAEDPTEANQAVRKAYVDSTRFLGIIGPPPVYKNASSITIPAGLKCYDSTQSHLIAFDTASDCNLAVSGAGGLDAGSEAANTWYYVYVIADTTATEVPSVVFSSVNEAAGGSITLPGGYDIKRQLPLAVRNNSTSDMLNFYVGSGWPHRPEIIYRTIFTSYSNVNTVSSAGNTNVLYAGSSTSWANITNTAYYVPPISQLAKFLVVNQQSRGQLSAGGLSTYMGIDAANQSSANNTTLITPDVPTDSSQAIRYKLLSGTIYVDVYSFTVTEVY